MLWTKMFSVRLWPVLQWYGATDKASGTRRTYSLWPTWCCAWIWSGSGKILNLALTNLYAMHPTRLQYFQNPANLVLIYNFFTRNITYCESQLMFLVFTNTFVWTLRIYAIRIFTHSYLSQSQCSLLTNFTLKFSGTSLL